jgi:hypothetical protein
MQGSRSIKMNIKEDAYAWTNIYIGLSLVQYWFENKKYLKMNITILAHWRIWQTMVAYCSFKDHIQMDKNMPALHKMQLVSQSFYNNIQWLKYVTWSCWYNVITKYISNRPIAWMVSGYLFKYFIDLYFLFHMTITRRRSQFSILIELTQYKELFHGRRQR